METRLLRYFLTLAHEENITRAAEVLHITQPTLSRQLAQLEDETGTTLFIRGKRKIELTSEGMLLRRRAEEILTLIDRTEKELLEQSENMTGTICLGCGELRSFNIVAQIIKTFREECPKIKFKLYTGNSDQLKEQLDQGLIDIALLLEPVNVEKYEFIRLPVKERYGVIMPAGCALAQKDYVRPDDLKGLPLITGMRNSVTGEFDNWAGGTLEQNYAFSIDLAANAVLMVEHGLGYMLTMEKVIPYFDESKVTFRPIKPERSFSTLLAWKRYVPGSAVTEKFIQHIKCFLSMNEIKI
ncbi:MAG: transcriptional regulator [Phascolarctobacterium sp.]|nr:MAG: transcriptional regulator [Phascolarctobacterium sp.]